jgi:molecular chaperone DnaK (HSP70)
MPPIVGIDLGTTNSLLAHVDYRSRVETADPGSRDRGPSRPVVSDDRRGTAWDQPRAGRARARRDGAAALFANNVCRAASQIATAAGCLSFLSTEIA